MKKLLGVLLALVLPVSFSFAYNDDHHPRVSSESNEGNHGEIGAFFNYFRLNNPVAEDTNFYGVGGRVGFNISRHVALEAEGAYDFAQNAELFDVDLGSFVTSDVRVAHFMFGPKFQVGTTGPVRFFVTAKGGLIDFSTDASFTGQVEGIPGPDTFATFYPALGFEFFAHWLGIRMEAGDEMYFNGGVNHNARVTAGPVIRF
jgi:hypothetical protein